MRNDFFYAQPVKIWFGEGCFARLEEILRELSLERCVLVCGRHFAPEAKKLLQQIPAICAVFSEVEPNPQLSGAAQAARLARMHKAQAVIGIGGGSAMDTAKFAAAIAPGEASAEAYWSGEVPLPADPLAILCVPTTAGTGSEVTQVSVISHGSANALHLKQWLIDHYGILIREASNFRSLDTHCFRVTARTPEDDDRLVEAIKAYLDSLEA